MEPLCSHLSKAFLREEGGPRSGGRSLRNNQINSLLKYTHSPSVASRQLPPGGSLKGVHTQSVAVPPHPSPAVTPSPLEKAKVSANTERSRFAS